MRTISSARLSPRDLSPIKDREICCYSISCKEKENIGRNADIAEPSHSPPSLPSRYHTSMAYSTFKIEQSHLDWPSNKRVHEVILDVFLRLNLQNSTSAFFTKLLFIYFCFSIPEKERTITFPNASSRLYRKREQQQPPNKSSH